PLPPVFGKVEAAFNGQPPADAAKPAETNVAEKAETKGKDAKPADTLEEKAKAFEVKFTAALAKKGIKIEVIQKLGTDIASGKLKQPPEKLVKDLTEVMSGLQSELMPLLEAGMAGAGGKGAGKLPFPVAGLQDMFKSMMQQTSPASADAAVQEADGGESETPPVVKLVKGMFDDASQVGRAYKLAKAMLAKIEDHARFAENFNQVTKEDLDQLTKLNNFLKEEVDTLAYEKSITEIPRRCAGLKKTVESVKNELTSLLAIQKQQKLEAEKKAKAEAEAEKKRQEADALKAKTDAECQKVAEAESAASVPLRTLDFRQARRTIRDLDDEIETEGGKTASLLALERIQRFENFHKYLSEKVTGYKSIKGWTITASDAKTLTVGNSKIPWKTVYNEKMAIFAELVLNFVSSSEKTKGLHLRERSRLKTNAAIALSLFYSSNESAMKLARKLANEAAEQFDADAEDIKALVPKFFTNEPATGD
ncbi:MAG: hypothetical protein J5985_08050, partial [Kiritimatiellae bacterium]|nr:hypothetical protein [Kiritimatiellia bacterium]